MAMRFVWVRLRLFLIGIVMAAGFAAIAILQWPEAEKASGYGSGTYSQGFVGTMLLAALMAGIPAVLFAIVAYLGLTWLLFKPGEIERFRRHKIIESVIESSDAVSTPTSTARRFED